jgi:flavin-dependent dehydrogenase
VICCIPAGWIWIIPFGEGVASVGVVTTPASTLRGTAEERLRAGIAAAPDATARLSDAERILPLRGLQDFTASARVFHGPGFALCGDAATFIDPVFSSGVLLGLHGARQLAQALDGGDLDGWEAGYREGAGVFRKVIDHWYSGDFMTLALAPPERQKTYVRRGIVSLLAGDVFDPERRAARSMADRMPGFAARIRERNAQLGEGR